MVSHTCVEYPMGERTKFLNELQIEKVKYPHLAVIVGHEYSEGAQCDCRRHHGLRYVSYFIPARYNLKYSII